MSTTIDTVFMTQWDSDVFTAYQRKGSLLRGTVREKSVVPGESGKFPKYGTGSVGSKGKHGLVPVMNAAHSIVSVTVSDYYGGEYIDDLDELKTNIDERQQAASALAMAAGRKVDERIIAAAEAIAGSSVGVGTAAFDKTRLLALVKAFHAADIPEDGQKYCILAPQAWIELLDIPEIKSRDYMTTMPWMDGYKMMDFLGIKFIMHNGLNITGTVRNGLAWHRPAMGSAWVADLRSNFDWIAERAAHFAQVRISMEAIGIEAAGVFLVPCKE